MDLFDKVRENLMEKKELEAILAKGPIPLPRNEDVREWTPEGVVALVCNPIYAGVPPYPALIKQKVWIKSFSLVAERYGLELVLRIMLDDLRQVYGKEKP